MADKQDTFAKFIIGIASVLNVSAIGMLIDVKIQLATLSNQEEMNRKFWIMHNHTHDRLTNIEHEAGLAATPRPNLN